MPTPLPGLVGEPSDARVSRSQRSTAATFSNPALPGTGRVAQRLGDLQHTPGLRRSALALRAPLETSGARRGPGPDTADPRSGDCARIGAESNPVDPGAVRLR